LNVNNNEDAMADKSKEEGTMNEEKPKSVSRRKLLLGGGAGLVVGSAVGYGVLPRPKKALLTEPTTWIGRNLENCTGCRLCQIACSEIKEQKIQPAIARISVHQFYPGIEFPVACYQCGDGAKCAEACPVDALSVDSSKGLHTIKIDTSRCTRTTRNSSCTACQDKCPGKAVTFHPKTKEPLICDLCGGDPACLKVCPSKTITLKGLKMATVSPLDIAAGLALRYDVPAAYKEITPTNVPLAPPPAAKVPPRA
jgi:Fe-S-cluster-containing hydrogenase component 2